MYRSELYFPIRTDIRVLEKKFKELESRLTLQNPDQGLTLRELANLHTSRIPTEDSEIGTQPVADLRGGARDARPPGGPNSFIFMQFSAKKIGWHTHFGSWRPPWGKSWIRH